MQGRQDGAHRPQKPVLVFDEDDKRAGPPREAWVGSRESSGTVTILGLNCDTEERAMVTSMRGKR